MKVHIFVDAENVSPKIFLPAYLNIKEKYDIFQCDIYGKDKSISSIYGKITGNNIVKHNTHFGKNCADVFMCTDIVKACYEEPLMDAFCVMTQDKDFSNAIKVLTDKDRYVIVVTEQNKLMSNLKSIGVNLDKIENMEIDITSEDDIHSSCFIKLGKDIIELPFYSGIPLDEFGNTIKKFNCREYYPKRIRLTDICIKNLLKVVNNHVYFRKENEYED